MSSFSTPGQYKSWLHNYNVKMPYTTIRRYQKKILSDQKEVMAAKSKRSLFETKDYLKKKDLPENLKVEESFSFQNLGNNSFETFEPVENYSNDSSELRKNELDLKIVKQSNKIIESNFDRNLSIKLSILNIYIDYRPTKSCMNAFIKMLRNFVGSDVPANFDSLVRSFQAEFFINYDTYHYCVSCDDFVDILHNSRCTKCNKLISRFYHLNIRSQIDSILKSQNDILDFEENTDNEIYRKISSNHNNFITLTINTDGMSVFKSSKTTIWPVYLTINQLDKQHRFKLKNVLLAGLWVSREKPVFEVFLKSIIEELKILEQGIVINGEIVKIFLTNGVFDKPARAAILNTIQFNGKFGCIKCYQPGKNIPSAKNGTVHVYPYQHYHYNKPQRTHEKYLNDLKEAVHLKKPFRGIKGESILNQLSYYYPIESTVIDYMHSILEGVVKSLIKYSY
ncbi:unnamed protein product [Brachionus calyciflorus]|uniref:Transposase domain-containing protein n=1 Tax=Brachionus calyciflorus TaxID=104777 RepID=A0A814ISZ9_9BILA|nr:unnamed protein product [Brachionus calyciflorus]